MLDIVQTATPAPAASVVTAATATPAGSGNSGETGGFGTIMDKAMGEEKKAPLEGEAEGDALALLHPGGENLPIDGRPLPNAMSISTAMLTQTASPPHSDVRPDDSLESGLEGLPVQSDGRLVGYLRSASKLEKEGPIAQAVVSTPPTATTAQSKDMPVVTVSEASGQFARLQVLQTDNSAATTPLMDFAAPTPPQHNIHFASALTQAGLAGVSPQSTQAAVASAAVPTPVQQPQWGEDVSNRVVWMVKQDIQAADMRLNPPHLGPLEVRISMTQDQVNISFSTHHGAVREALDNAMPRLREMLADNGLQLANANVSHRSPSDQQGGAQHYGGNGLAHGEEDGGGVGADGSDISTSLSSSSLYLVDYYA